MIVAKIRMSFPVSARHFPSIFPSGPLTHQRYQRRADFTGSKFVTLTRQLDSGFRLVGSGAQYPSSFQSIEILGKRRA